MRVVDMDEAVDRMDDNSGSQLQSSYREPDMEFTDTSTGQNRKIDDDEFLLRRRTHPDAEPDTEYLDAEPGKPDRSYYHNSASQIQSIQSDVVQRDLEAESDKKNPAKRSS